MNKMVKRSVGAALLVVVGGMGVTSCVVENESSVFVRQVLVPSGADCTVAADPGSSTVSVGTLDVMLGGGYQAELLVGNQLVARGSESEIRTETSRFVIDRAEVKIAGYKDKGFSQAVSGFVDPGSGSAPGWGVASAVLVTGDVVAQLRSEMENGAPPRRILTSVRIKGHTLGGQEEETGWYDFPIDVCYGCLLMFPADADDPAIAGADCKLKGEGTQQAIPCRLGQDATVDCRACHAAGLGEVCEP